MGWSGPPSWIPPWNQVSQPDAPKYTFTMELVRVASLKKYTDNSFCSTLTEHQPRDIWVGGPRGADVVTSFDETFKLIMSAKC